MPAVAARASGGPFRAVTIGQSLCLAPTEATSWPALLLAGRGIPWSNEAIAGFPWAFLLTDDYQPLVLAQADLADVVVLLGQGGQGDLTGIDPLLAPADGATTFARAVQYATEARDAGFTHVIWQTIPPSPLLFTVGNGLEAERQAHNALLLDHAVQAPGVFDAVVDVGSPSLADGLHPDAAGAQAMADATVAPFEAIVGPL